MDTYGPGWGRNIKSKSEPGLTKLLIVLLLFIGILTYILISKYSTPKIISPVASFHPTGQPTKNNKNNTKSTPVPKLIPALEKAIENEHGTYSVYIYEINSKKEYGINESMVITAASVNKIPILAALYRLAGDKKIDLEKVVVPQPSDIQDYGTGSIRYDPPGTPYSIKTLARLMMEKSDNTAAYILGSYIVGLDKITELNKSWGLTQTDMYENKTSVRDMSILMSKIYKGEVAPPALTIEMLDLMDKSDFDDRLNLGLPEGQKIFHKTGDEVGKIHDVGIVDLDKKPYFIGVMTTDMIDEAGTKNKIGEISKIVYDFLK